MNGCYNSGSPSNMTSRDFLRAGVLLAAFAALAACTAPKYVKYVSPSGDFTCDVPWGWAVYFAAAGSDYMSATFTGPMDPEFLRGTPGSGMSTTSCCATSSGGPPRSARRRD